MLLDFDLLGAEDQHIGHAVNLLGLADLVADLLVGLIQHNADTGGLQLGGDVASRSPASSR